MAYDETINAAGAGTAAPVIVALFDDAKDAHLAVTQLRGAGFSPSQIGAAFRGDSMNRYAEHNPAVGAPAGNVRHEGETWWEKVKDAFHPDDQKVEARREIAADPDLDVDPYAREEYEYDFEDRS
ncbi:MAG TPA: hypothetical protein VN828_15330, partial [Acidobacteriaceae bacterium]|nr:hypothetical protein [Acidobacteriaceae bacterium]